MQLLYASYFDDLTLTCRCGWSSLLITQPSTNHLILRVRAAFDELTHLSYSLEPVIEM
jgi:hypothetical protein